MEQISGFWRNINPRTSILRVTVIATVYNEADTILRLLESLTIQTRRPDEVIIVDGGSNDGTIEMLHAFAATKKLPLKIILRMGANISQGRNTAILAAQGEIIAATDAGVRLTPRWLDELIRPFFEALVPAHAPDVVSGFFLPDPQSTFEIALGVTTLPVAEDINPEKFLPSSRSVAFRRSFWQSTGGYPEWLDYCEDLVFDMRLRQIGARFVFAPRAIAYFRPRQYLRQFMRQYYRYARGDGKANLFPMRHLIRYATYLLAGPLLFWLGLRLKYRWIWGALAAGVVAMMAKPYRRLWPYLAKLPLTEQVKAIGWVPVIRIAGDLAKMAGYPAGWRWRRRQQPTPHVSVPKSRSDAYTRATRSKNV
ncbi:MAG: glycosyltransferase [Chloroflexi bacterium]|nr:glycosyltransferase [Chloroflexota bacterium]